RRTFSVIAPKRPLRRRVGGNRCGTREHSRLSGSVTFSPTWCWRGGPHPGASGVVTQQSATVCSGQQALRFVKALWASCCRRKDLGCLGARAEAGRGMGSSFRVEGKCSLDPKGSWGKKRELLFSANPHTTAKTASGRSSAP